MNLKEDLRIPRLRWRAGRNFLGCKSAVSYFFQGNAQLVFVTHCT